MAGAAAFSCGYDGSCQYVGTRYDNDAIQCSSCSKWGHAKCYDISKSHLSFLTGRKNLKFQCNVCENKNAALMVLGLPGEFKTLQASIEKLMAKTKDDMERNMAVLMAVVSKKVDDLRELNDTQCKHIAELMLKNDDLRQVNNAQCEHNDVFGRKMDELTEIIVDLEDKIIAPPPPLPHPATAQTADVAPAAPAAVANLAAAPASYAAVARNINTLIIKNQDGKTESEMKAVVKEVLRDVKIDRMKMTQKGSIVLNLPDRETSSRAKRLFDSDDRHLETMEPTKHRPKIMITNVSMDEDKDEVADYILAKNDFLDGFSPEDLQLAAVRRTRHGTQNIILKCSPAARKVIRDNGDLIYTAYGRHNVYDRYHVIICNFCQQHGHMEEKCEIKAKNGQRTCGRCGGSHDTNNCNTDVPKCHLCSERKLPNIDHCVFQRVCPFYREKERWLIENTDHGV